jgi:hypothetical protein
MKELSPITSAFPFYDPDRESRTQNKRQTNGKIGIRPCSALTFWIYMPSAQKHNHTIRKTINPSHPEHKHTKHSLFSSLGSFS